MRIIDFVARLFPARTQAAKPPSVARAKSPNPLAGKPLRYLIGADRGYAVDPEVITEVGYDDPKPQRGLAIAYCNLFDEHNTGKLGPYLHSSDTAETYDEGQIDPSGPGWQKNLRAQFERRKRQGFEYLELDNPDAYDLRHVLGAIDLAASYGFKVIAKNPLLVEPDPFPYLQHPSVVGAIVEKDAGTPQQMDQLRKRAGKPDLPVWFVAFGSRANHAWATTMAMQAKSYRHMGVTFSQGGEYTASTDVLHPIS